MAKLTLNEELFGDLLPLIKDDNITDINFNGEELWVNDLNNGRYKITNITLDELFIKNFAQRISNITKENFNKYSPLLEGETDTLRVSILHKDVTNTGYSVSIRKTPPTRRIEKNKMVKEKYCTSDFDNFMANAVLCGLNVIVCGLPGTGKTEYVKYLTRYIPPHEKAITIEDNLEIRYREINPGKDCVELKVSDTMDYDAAIKASMRQLPTWILLSEARSVEIEELLKSMSTGTHCLTTIHTDDVRKIPDRVRNMSKSVNINDVYTFLDIGILITSKVDSSGKITRKITQAGFITRDNEKDENNIVIFYEDGKILTHTLPDDIKRKMELRGILNPFEENKNVEKISNLINTKEIKLEKKNKPLKIEEKDNTKIKEEKEKGEENGDKETK